jgi:hypothetical protein
MAHNKGKSVMLDQEFAATIYTPIYFFVQSQMRKWRENNPQASKERKIARRKWLRKKWMTEKEKDINFGAGYDKRARDHNSRQKGTKGELVEIMNVNARRSYASLQKAMNNWCSWKTIERFLKSHEDFSTYSQNIRPLLSEGNRLKQVSFSRHVHNRWGLAPGTKILWTMRYQIYICIFIGLDKITSTVTPVLAMKSGFMGLSPGHSQKLVKAWGLRSRALAANTSHTSIR